MVTYYAATYYQLLISILHKNKYHKNDKSVLLIDKFIQTTCKNINNIVNCHFFDEYYSLAYVVIESENETDLLQKCLKELTNIPYDIKQSDYIYVSAAHFWFGIYLGLEDVPFSMFEECSGILSKIDKLKENVANTSIQQVEFAERFGLFDGDSDLITSIYCSGINDEYILNNSKVIIFDLIDELNSCSNEMIDDIISIFTDQKKILLENNGLLLLTQHFANVGIMSWEEQKEIYKIVADYFIKPNTQIVIKTHPADVMAYEQIFPDSIVLRSPMPSELLPYICDKIPSSVLTISSTAIDAIGMLFKEKIAFDFQYENCYPVTHTYYLMLKQMDNYVAQGYRFYIYSSNTKLMNNLNDYSDVKHRNMQELESIQELENIVSKSIVYIDDMMMVDIWKSLGNILENAEKDVIFIFLNTKNQYLFFDGINYSVSKYLRPVEIKLKSNNIVRIIGRSYIYSKGELADMSNEYKQLHYEEGIAYTEMFKDDKEKVKILEGMLKATEERLKFYVEREQELLKELEGK